jgi:hypothetical protein
MMLELGHFRKYKFLIYGLGEGWRRSVAPIVLKMKYYIESRNILRTVKARKGK